MKRALRWVGVVVGVLVVLIVGVGYSAFGGNRPIVDGQVLAPGATVVKDGFVSVVILDAGPGKVALVDAGNDPTAKATLAALTARGLTADSVAAIFLTHGHGDHTAGCKMFPGAKVSHHLPYRAWASARADVPRRTAATPQPSLASGQWRRSITTRNPSVRAAPESRWRAQGGSSPR